MIQSPVHTVFFAELGIRQPFVARREVKQIPKKRQLFGSRWDWEARTFSDLDVNEDSENKRGKNGDVV